MDVSHINHHFWWQIIATESEKGKGREGKDGKWKKWENIASHGWFHGMRVTLVWYEWWKQMSMGNMEGLKAWAKSFFEQSDTP